MRGVKFPASISTIEPGARVGSAIVTLTVQTDLGPTTFAAELGAEDVARLARELLALPRPVLRPHRATSLSPSERVRCAVERIIA